MPNSYSRQHAKMFVDRGCEVFKAGKREKELEREKAMHEMGTKWGQDVLRSGRFKHFVMFWHRMISNAAGAVRRQERLQKEQAKTGDANQHKPTHMDHHGSTCHLVSHCRVEWEFSVFSWPTPRAMSSSGEFAEGSGGQTSPQASETSTDWSWFCTESFRRKTHWKWWFSSYDLAFTMPPTVSNQSKEKIC